MFLYRTDEDLTLRILATLMARLSAPYCVFSRPNFLRIAETAKSMFSRVISVSFFLVVAGCGTTANTVEPEAPPPTEIEPEDAGVVIVEAPEPEPDPIPGECEVLLQNLQAIRPLLEGLDDSILAQSERIDEVVAELNRPVQEPPALVCPPNIDGSLGGKEIIGAIEWVYMDPPGRHFRARVDSGAETSTLGASDMVQFERDGEDWVRFTFQHESTEEAVEFERPIARTVLIRQLSSREPERRFVIELDIGLGDQLQTTEFTLTDRGRMTYPISLGRAFVMDLYVIDVSRSYTHERFDASD